MGCDDIFDGWKQEQHNKRIQHLNQLENETKDLNDLEVLAFALNKLLVKEGKYELSSLVKDRFNIW